MPAGQKVTSSDVETLERYLHQRVEVGVSIVAIAILPLADERQTSPEIRKVHRTQQPLTLFTDIWIEDQKGSRRVAGNGSVRDPRAILNVTGAGD